jgi:ABC-type nitrate/sulfonate/bicarbonate transport system ATPase subunit
MSDAVLSAEGLNRIYPSPAGDVHVLHDVALELHAGELVVLRGPSGAGKTTLLNLLGGLDTPSSGSIRVDGAELTTLGEDELAAVRQTRLGYIFQSFGLISVLSAAENIDLALRIQGMTGEARRTRVDEVLGLVGLTEQAQQRPYELSGGQQQRVGIARALALDPSVLLMDEPFGALDAITREKLQRDIADILARQPKTILFITHNMDEAIFFSDRILVMGTRPGRILEEVRVDLPRPREADAVRASREFATMREHLWSLLSDGGKAA